MHALGRDELVAIEGLLVHDCRSNVDDIVIAVLGRNDEEKSIASTLEKTPSMLSTCAFEIESARRVKYLDISKKDTL